MHEYPHERIEQLERRVRRWRLVSFVLAVLLVCALAVGGTFVVVLMVQAPDRREMQLLMERERAMRERAEQAERMRQQTERQLEAARKDR